jgi:electron transfer flavoprotein beta subunit
MNVLVCVKRVPETGARITLTADEQEIDTSYLGFTISPHEECAVEEAIRIGAAHSASTTVLTLGPAAAAEQLRSALAMGIQNAMLLETDGSELDPGATASAIAEAVRGRDFDLLLFGNESADSGGYQVPVRVGALLGLPVVTGGGWEIFEAPLPAVVSVKEGINLPRYPSLPGQIRAKKAELERVEVPAREASLEKVRLVVPQEAKSEVQVLGEGAAAAPRVVEVLKELGVA